MKMLTTDQVAGLASVPKKTVQRWATDWERNGFADGPRPRRLSERITRYRLDDVAEWLGVDPAEIRGL